MSMTTAEASLKETLERLTRCSRDNINANDTVYSPNKYRETEGIKVQETLALGEATGQFAELLDRSKVDVDAFNKTLSGLATEAERNQFALETLNNIGLAETLKQFGILNPEVEAAREAQANLQLALSALSIVLTPLVTLVSEIVTRFVEWASANPELVTTLAVVMGVITVLGGVFATLAPAIGMVIQNWGVLKLALAAITGPIGIAVAGIALIGTGLVAAYQHSETFRDGISTVFNAVKDIAVNVFTAVSSFIQDKISEIRKFWDENGAQIGKAFENVFNAIKKVVEAVMPVVQSLVEGAIDAIKNVIDGGLNFIMGLVKTFSGLFTGDFKGMWEGIKQMFSGAVEALWGIVQLGFAGKILKVVKGFADDAVKFITDMVSKTKGKFDEIVSAASTKFNSLKDKILTPIKAAKDTIKGIIDDIKGFFSGMSLKIPEIKLPKLPKFTLTGDFSLNPPSVPKLGIKWNALGGVFNKPTILNSSAGLQGVGEAGAEAILPLKPDVLAGIGKGIAEQMNGGMPSTIVVQSVLDGRIVAETITPFVSQNQQSNTSLKAMSRGVQL